MAITAEQRNEVISLLVGMFDAAPSAELLTGFVTSIEGGQSLPSLANDLAATDEFKSLYPVWLTNEEFATNFATNFLDGNTDAATLAEGIDFVTALLNGGATRGEVAAEAVAALSAVPVTDPTWGEAAQGLANKVEVATYFATTKLTSSYDFASLRSVVADVNADAESVTDQKILIDAGLGSLSQSLTTGQDSLVGSAGGDAFTAWIFDNQNTAQSGDSIDGGAGDDTLFAQIGDSQNFAITLHTDSVETAIFQAQADANANNADNDNQGGLIDDDDEVQIDAQYMNGTLNFWSQSSRADLLIEDIQADSHTVTVGWRDSDPGNVDYEVYFDNITAPSASTSGSQLFLELLDLEGMATDGDPLLNNPYVGLTITVDGVEVELVADEPVQTSYADLVAGINDILDNLGYDTITASLGTGFTAINSDDGIAYAGTTIVLTNTGPEILGAVGWQVDGVLPPDSNVHTSIDDTPPATAEQLTQTNVIFDYVGSGSKSGTFIAGEMSNGDFSGSTGIQQFNIDVDRSSRLETVMSTGAGNYSALEVINVENISDNSDGTGSLSIDMLEDVRVFDASAMAGSVRVTGALSDNVVSKYLDTKDDDSDPTADNSENAFDNVVDREFSYDGGAGNDVISVLIDDANLEAAGTASREDFVLEITGGDGADSLSLAVIQDADVDDDFGDTTVDNGALAASGFWYTNHKANSRMEINAGSGDDTVRTPGSSDVQIRLGAGNDTVYSDNSGIAAYGGEDAKWVINGDNFGLADIDGDNTEAAFMPAATLTVTFSAASIAAVDSVTEGAAAALSNGWEASVSIPTGTNYVATDLHINQAIKDAINNDPVLSKLLMAADGPGHSLIVTSLIDGEFRDTDLLISVSAPDISSAAFTASQQNDFTSAFQAFTSNSAATIANAQAANAAAQTTFNGMNGMSTNQQLLIDDNLAPGDVVDTAAETVAGVAFEADVSTLTITADDADNDDETITVTYDATGAGAGGGAVVAVALDGTVDATDANAVATFVANALNADGGFSAVAVASAAANVVTVTYSAANNGDNDVATTAAIGGTTATLAAAGAEVTAGVLGVAEQQTFNLDTNLPLGVANGGALFFTVDGEILQYTNDTGGTLIDDALEADILAELGAALTINGRAYTLANAGGTDDLTLTQTGAFSQFANIAASTASTSGLLSGQASTATSDNVILGEAGDDVLVLSTSLNSNDVLFFYGSFGDDTLVNFSTNFFADGFGGDILNFGLYLTNVASASGSSTSEQVISAVVQDDATIINNELNIINGFAQNAADGETWAALTGEALLAAINDDNDDATDGFGNIIEASLAVGTTGQNNANLVGDTVTAMVMVENDLNDGEYKVFTVTGEVDGDFTSATLVGTLDFGDTVTATELADNVINAV